MEKLRADLVKMIAELTPGEGMHSSPLSGVHCIKISQTDGLVKRYWRAALSLVVQGSKEIMVGRERYRYGDEVHYVVTAIDLPVTSRVFSATPERPFLCLKLDFDPLVLREVEAQLGQGGLAEPAGSLRPVFIGKAGEPMLEAALRLGKLLLAPADAAVLGPLVVREILYHFLKGPDGPAFRQFVRAGSKLHKISQAIYTVRSGLGDEIDVVALAKGAGMSRSAFFKHFKAMTAMSPIQYQKRLRLLEARRLMTDEGETAEGSAFKVGYNSASQFSREYTRMFGRAPGRDAVKIKKTGHPIHSM